MWRKYFKLKNIIPGRVHFARFGMIDFRQEDLPIDILKRIYDEGSTYLELTDEGREFFEGGEQLLQKTSTSVGRRKTRS